MSFCLSAEKYLVAEGSMLKFAVLRRGDIILPEMVNISTTAGSARSGIDFEPLDKDLIFLKGERQKDLEITVYADSELEFDEVFYVKLLQLPVSYAKIINPEVDFWGLSELGEPNISQVTILDVESFEDFV